MHQPYTQPAYWMDAFNCPHCGAFSNQYWGRSTVAQNTSGGGRVLPDLSAAICARCGHYSLWSGATCQMLYPTGGTAPLPNPDLPKEIASDYLEAREIASASPRGAAALLRLCIQKLCIQLGQPGKDLNKDIGALVASGLNPMIQKSLDIVRVIGNESVHPGTVDLRDDPSITTRLFALVNIIADVMITQPKMIEETYGVIPAGKREGIQARDAKIKS